MKASELVAVKVRLLLVSSLLCNQDLLPFYHRLLG